MKILVYSDIHIEFYRDTIDKIDEILYDVPEVDVCVIAGDFGVYPKSTEFVKRFASHFPKIVYVPGNHEFYNYKTIQETLSGLRKQLKSSNIHVLYNDMVEIDNIEFWGTTLWFEDFPTRFMYQNMLNDFHCIDKFKERFATENNVAKCFINQMVESPNRKVLITHHVPYIENVAEVFANSPINPFFVNNLGNILDRSNAELVVHGHTHNSFDYMRGETRVVCNPMGYYNDPNPDFKQTIIELKETKNGESCS